MSPEISSRSGSPAFPVDNVTPATKPVWTESLIENLTRRFMRKIVFLPKPTLPVINEVYDSISREWPGWDAERLGAASRCHPLIDAVHIAFSQHRPLLLSPDCVWLTIAQGFSHHIAANGEAFRRRLVRREGTRQLKEEPPTLEPRGL